jgi:hypothetical protein
MMNLGVKSKPDPFIYLLFILAVILIISPLFQQGLFIDGLLYKTVANNYFSGEGTFWKMKFNDVSMNPFYEQPPLFFFITGSFFKVFGNSFIADKLLTVGLLFIQSFLLLKICRQLFKDYKPAFFICLFLLLSIPVLCWSYVNQVIETMVLPLALLGFHFFLLFKNKKNIFWKETMYLLGFSFSVILLFLTKGFQSCFIIITPFLYFFFFKDKKSLWFGTFSLLIICAVLYFIFFINEPSGLWFDNYLQKRLIASLNNVGATTSYRAEIILRIFTELLAPLLLIASAAIYSYLKNKSVHKRTPDKNGWILLFIALAGSVPFAVTLEQRGFYLVPSFPFFVLALILFFKPFFLNYYEIVGLFFKRKAMHYSLLSLLIISCAYWVISPRLYKRDENVISDLKLIQPFIREKDTISIDGDVWNDTKLQAYLYMGKRVNVECGYSHAFYIRGRENNTAVPGNYKRIEIPTKQYDLFMRLK